MTSIFGFARPAALAAATLLATVSGAVAADSGYFSYPDYPLVPPTLYSTGSPQATIEQQRASGYFGDAGDALYAPSAATDPSGTIAKQRASGYFPDAGAPLYPATPQAR